MSTYNIEIKGGPPSEPPDDATLAAVMEGLHADSIQYVCTTEVDGMFVHRYTATIPSLSRLAVPTKSTTCTEPLQCGTEKC